MKKKAYKRRRKIILVASIIAILLLSAFYLRERILCFINNDNIEEIIEYCVENEIESLCVANKNSDGSELLINDIPVELRKNFETVINSTKFMCGPESRIYCWVDLKETGDHVFRVSTSKNWKNSIFYWGDINYEYDWDDVDIIPNWKKS